MSRLWGRLFQVRNPIPLKIRRVWGLLHAKSYVMAKRPPAGVAWKLREGMSAQVSSSSSGRGSKLRGPSQNNPRVASKRDVDITKLVPKYEYNAEFQIFILPVLFGFSIFHVHHYNEIP
ncbi:hypothetical protein AVEN_23008-1 [Araneus ventricosus]|uniref:Uncharacterized protein n=1 Tax=Araneus ventricosus TaxID=182803 RepID=A0A4Y2TID1_ARAVE|nr:hypothetical protein AVEN_23008-1 [Araneus ventricosus]